MFDVEDFILAVKERPALYNPTNYFYNRKEVRTQLWNEIGKIMYSDWESLDSRDKNEKGAFMQKKWKSLKDCFNREVRLQKSENPNKFRKKYEFYEQLSFLHWKRTPELFTLPLSSNQVRIKLETIEKDVSAPSQPSQPSVTGENSTGIEIPEWSRKRKLAKKELENPKQQRKVEDSEDGDRLFLVSFVDDLKKLPLATKYWVKMKFSEIMHQALMSFDSTQVEMERSSVDYDSGSPELEIDFDDETKSPDSSSSEILVDLSTV